MTAGIAADGSSAGDPSAGSTSVKCAASLRGLDWVNFFLADVQTGVGPFLAAYLKSVGWNEQTTGIAMTVSSMAGIITQSPAGGLVDRSKSKRLLIAMGVICLAIGGLLIAFFPSVVSVMSAQVLIGGTSSIFIPCVCAIALGLVGPKNFDRRQGRNQTFNSAGNVFAAASMGLLGYFVSNRSIFFFVAFSSVPTFLCLLLIRPEEIDNEVARGGEAKGGEGNGSGGGQKPTRILDLLKNKPLAIFLTCAVLFHFANAAMLPLLGEMLMPGKKRLTMVFMMACIITTQLTITLLASGASKATVAWGRKPVLLVAFAVLPVRGLLYTLTSKTALLVAIQVLDGIGAGIFGVVSVLVIADLTAGTGRFNLMQGLIATAVGIGASLSQTIAGTIVHHFGYHAGFVFLSMVAGVALGIFWWGMPETKNPERYKP